ncbi:MAG: YfhO family protein [Hyphomicrobiales bacterium]|nr:YfhO family protein [Hyphomicrobiales bacterium]
MNATERSARIGAPDLWFVLVVLALAWVWLTRPWLFGGLTVPWDAEAHFRAQLGFLAHSIHEGRGIAWNPWIFAGWSQISDPQSLIFVPVFLILALVDPDPSAQAMDAAVFVQLAVGGLFLALWFRDRGWHAGGAVVAALAFAFGGSAAWRLQHTGQVATFAMLPVVLFCLDRMVARRSIWWGLWTGVAAGLLVMGRDQIALLSIYYLFGHALWEIFTRPRPLGHFAATILPGLAVIVGGLLVVAVPVAMTMLLVEHSNRPAIDFIGAGKGSLPPEALISAVIADLFGQGDQKVDYWGPPSPAFGYTDVYLAQNMGAVYAGAIPILTILLAGIGRGRLFAKEIGWQAIAAAFFVLYTVGWYTPAFHVFYDVMPGVKLYRRPADGAFLIGFAIAVLGGWLTHRLLTEPRPGPSSLPVKAIQATILAIVFAVLPIAFGLHADRLALVWKPLLTALAFAAAGGVVIVAARAFVRDGSPRGGAIAVALLGLFTAFDLSWNNAPNESTAYPTATFDALNTQTKDPVVAFLKAKVAENDHGVRRDRVELVGIGFHWPNIGMLHGLEHTLGYNPLRTAIYEAATGAIDHIAIPEQKTFTSLNPSYDALLDDMLGLRWIATSLPIEKIDHALKPGRLTEVAHFPAIPGIYPAPGRPETWIYENPRALPRVLLVDRARLIDQRMVLAEGRWPDGFDPTREVLVHLSGEGTWEGPTPAAEPTATPPGKAEIVRYLNTEVAIDVDMERPGFLVLNDAWHRWWKVEIDGAPTDLYRANLLFRTLRVPAGRHRVRFTFRPFEGVWRDFPILLGAKAK